MYYATQTIDGVESNDRLAVKAIINNPQITASATEVCAGESVSLKAGEDLPTICNMNITLTKIPLGDPIPGFTYRENIMVIIITYTIIPLHGLR